MLKLLQALTKQCQWLRCSTLYPWRYFKGLLGISGRAPAAAPAWELAWSSSSVMLPGPGAPTAPAKALQCHHCSPDSKQHCCCKCGVRELYNISSITYHLTEHVKLFADTGILTWLMFSPCGHFITTVSAGLSHLLTLKVMVRATCHSF